MTRREELERLTASLREQFGALFDEVEALLFRHDPIRVNSAPSDEYRPEVRAMLPLLANCTSAADVAKMTHEVFVRFFNAKIAGAPENYDAIGAEIWELWQRR